MTTPVYKSGMAAALTVELPTLHGIPLIPTAVSRTVKDVAGVVISPSTSVDLDGVDSTNGTFEVLIDPSINAIGSAKRDLRTVTLDFTTAEGVFQVVESYILEADTLLERMVNTFVTYPESLLVRRDLVRLDGWDAASETDRTSGLVAAHDALTKLTYRYRGAFTQDRITFDPNTSPFWGDWTYIAEIGRADLEEWALYPIEFRNALQRAQLTHADVLLRGDPVGDKRRAGIISETIGESSMFFKQVAEVNLGISREAFVHLKGYLYRDARIARA